MDVSRMKRVPLRQLWPNEAYDFTTWLSKNLDLLGEEIGVELSLVEQETSVGPFSADLLAEVENGKSVVIENQLEKTDHDHLGKLITYLSNLEAAAAIWVTKEVRPEHERAIHWLNEMLPLDTSFYLLKLEAYQIDVSNPAPLFTEVAGPSPEARQIGQQKKEKAERHMKRKRFWAELLELANQKTNLHENRSPSTQTHLNAGAGRKGVVYQYWIRKHDAAVGLRIRLDTKKETKAFFDRLHEGKEEINERFGDTLDWRREDDIKASHIMYPIDAGGYADEEDHQEIRVKMVKAMLQLEKAFSPEIRAGG